MTGRLRRNADRQPNPLPHSLIAAIVVVSSALAVLAFPGLGGATTRAEPGLDQPTLRIVDQTTFVPADGVFELIVDVRGPTGPSGDPADPVAAEPDVGPVLSVAFFGRLETEDQVDLPPTQPINRLPGLAIDRAPRTADGLIRLSVPIRSVASFDDQQRVLLAEPGVYPITVELRDADGPLASARTHLVRLPIETADEPARAPVEVAVVLQVTTAEGLSPGEAAALLTEHPTVPITVILDHGVVNRLRSEPETASTLAAALGGRPVLTEPTIDLDPSALAEIGHDDLYLAAVDADHRALLDLGLQPAAGLALLGAPLTDAGLDVLARQGVAGVLDLDERFGDRGVIEPRGRAIEVIHADADLNRALRGADQPDPIETGPHRANRVLARLSLRGDVDDRPVVIGGPGLGVDPAPALAAFLRALSQPGAPRPVALSEIRGGPTLRVAEQPEQDLALVADLVGGLRQRLATYESFHLGGGTDPDDHRQRIVGALTRQRNPDDRIRALALVANQLERDLGTIHIHQPQPVTLAARTASIPLVVDNNASGARAIVIGVRSDRVVSADDGRRIVIEPGTSSIEIEVETRSLGASPIEVTARTPDGSVELARTRFEIRSTAVPGLGLLVTLSALGLLGLWWLLDHRRRRRAAIDDGEPGGRGPDRPSGATASGGGDGVCLDGGDDPGSGPAGAGRRRSSGETLEPEPTSV